MPFFYMPFTIDPNSLATLLALETSFTPFLPRRPFDQIIFITKRSCTPIDHTETAKRILPKRGLSASSLKSISGWLPKTPHADEANSPTFEEFEESVLIEQRRAGCVWSDEEQVGGTPAQETQIPHNSGGQPQGAVNPSSPSPKVEPKFEDFRKPDAPPPVLATFDVPALPTQRIEDGPEASAGQGKRRPKPGSRGVSFSKSLLGIRSVPEHLPEKDTERAEWQNQQRSPNICGASQGPDLQMQPHPKPISASIIQQPSVKKALTRSSTTSSVEEWLGLKKSKHDMRMVNLADQQKPASRRASLIGHLPRISTFRTESEHRALSKRSYIPDNATSSHDTGDAASSATSTLEPPLSPKKERPRFLRSISRKSLTSQPTMPSAESAVAEDLMSEALSPDEKQAPRSPSKIYAGLLWQSKRKANEDTAKGPILAKSRRTGTFGEIAAPPSQAPAPPVGVPEFKIPDLHPERPPLPKYPSSEVSPGDVSKQGLNHHLFDTFEKAITDAEVAKEINLRPPATRHKRAMKSDEYLATEAKRINTPPVVKPGKGNRLMGHFWDSVVPGVEDESHAGNLGGQQIHTPFPMPKESSTLTTSAPPTPTAIHVHTRDADWYRVRADKIFGDDEPERDVDELRTMFDWDVPEHLPSSPLCPANPKHSGGGTGVCVYHGRATVSSGL